MCVYSASAGGAVYSWGSNADGQLGHNDGLDHVEPTRITALDGRNVAQVAAGCDHCLCMTVSGDVFCWGSDKLGQLGLGEGMRQMSNFQQTAPRALVAFKQKVIYEIAAGYGHGIARTDINELWSWGLGTRGQLGLGRT